MSYELNNLDKLVERLNIGRSFRTFGGLGFILSLWTLNELALKLSVLTFIFGAIARILEMINKLEPIKKRSWLQALFWIGFLSAYSYLINVHLKILPSLYCSLKFPT